ncbi:AP-1 complex subunit mu-1 [Saguinus oedipus]|uniref:AP-1 complex subunit mu-1 n=1 Tax=Saguinus oedipus TaxID=9490 RepID=A0ABQ9TST4_SAGOE|nr:AP-1 complex subunit mu-1 [Saguinus oedipus]
MAPGPRQPSPATGGKEYLMRAHFGLPSVEAEDKEGKPPISVKFEIPYFTTSGIQVRTAQAAEAESPRLTRVVTTSRGSSALPRLCMVQTQIPFTPEVRYLKIIEKSGYQALPWVRYITQNGDYQLRTQ